MAEADVTVLEFSMVIFVYDGLCGAGVRLSELAFCKFREGNVKASTKCVCNPELGSLSIGGGGVGVKRTYHDK